MLALTGNPSPEVLDAILATREKRDTVLRQLHNHWKLSHADQLRLVQRSISSEIADLLVDSDDTLPDVKAIAVLRSSSSRRARWIPRANLADADALYHLAALDSPSWLFETLVPQLLLRPALRPSVLRSGLDQLPVAACWNELAPADQEYALELATKHRLTLRAGDPVLGMLAQPSLRSDLRTHLWDLLVYHHQSAEAVSYGLRPPGSSLYPGVPLASVEDSALLDLLLDVYSVTPTDALARVSWASVLHELSFNDHLSPTQLDRLIIALSLLASVFPYSRAYPLESDLVRLASALDPATHPTKTLQRFNVAETTLRAIKSAAAPTPPPPAVSTLHRPAGRLNYAPAEDLDKTLARTPVKMDYLQGRIQQMAPAFLAALGDGSDELSVRSWMTFLGLLEGNPDVSVSSILATARRLAKMELSEAK
jgi:hypothetical protein